MEFAFKNIDNYTKLRAEPLGDIQPKYWYIGINNASKKCLVKRQYSQRVSGQQAKSRMFNHFGEYFAYLLGKKADIDVCPVELITVHDTKNKYSKTRRFYTGCASYTLKEVGQELYAGELVILKFKANHLEKYQELLNTRDNNITNLTKGSITTNDSDDNVDIALAAIALETKEYETKMGNRTEEQIKQDIDANLKSAIEMIVYDCVFGNSDRHSQNWSMLYDANLGTVQMYPNYDNEAVLGLRKTEYEIKEVVHDISKFDDFSKKELFSRMGFAPYNSGVSYENMLEHLVNKYPAYAIPAMKKITDLVSEKDVSDLYDASTGISMRSEDAAELSQEDELPPEFKIFGVKLYAERREFARRLVKSFEQKQNAVVCKSEDYDELRA